MTSWPPPTTSAVCWGDARTRCMCFERSDTNDSQNLFQDVFRATKSPKSCTVPQPGHAFARRTIEIDLMRFFDITLRAKLSGAVYCNRSCLFVCLVVCRFVTTITRNYMHRSSPNWVYMKVVTISSWLNFGRPAPPGRGTAAGRNFLAPPYYSQRAVFASLFALFFIVQVTSRRSQTCLLKLIRLFKRLLDNEQHVLHPLLHDKTDISCNLRYRHHNYDPA